MPHAWIVVTDCRAVREVSGAGKSRPRCKRGLRGPSEPRGAPGLGLRAAPAKPRGARSASEHTQHCSSVGGEAFLWSSRRRRLRL